MAIGPLLPGRVPNSLMSSRLASHLTSEGNLLNRLQEQIQTGQKYSLPSQSPRAAIQAILLQQGLERQAQYQTSLSTARTNLSLTEQSLLNVSDDISRVKSIILSGTGSNSTAAEKQTLADEIATIRRNLVNQANSSNAGRYLFGGSVSNSPPFEIGNAGAVRYTGDDTSIYSGIDNGFQLANNITGAAAFAPGTAPVSANLNPALTLDTRISDLLGGRGMSLGSIQVTLDDGGAPQVATVDLSSAETVGDVKLLLENAFGGGPLALTVDIDPASQAGFRLTPSSGTVAVQDLAGSTVAADLGIAGPAAASIVGDDLDPRVTLQTTLASLNGGAGIGSGGFVIVNGEKTSTIDLSSAVTVEDLINTVKAADKDVSVSIRPGNDGLQIATRLSGVEFSVGENGGDQATQLGFRTLTGKTLLSSLNGGLGLPSTSGADGNALRPPLQITLRDGSQVTVDIGSAKTVQDVIDAIGAADPNLSASLNVSGNGITVVHNDGASTGPLIIAANGTSEALGIAGTDDSGDPTAGIVGADVNPQTSNGIFGILTRLENALRGGNNAELTHLGELIDTELDRFRQIQGEVGNRLQLVDRVDNQLSDGELHMRETLSGELDTNMSQAILEISQRQAAMQATMQVAASALRLSLWSYL